MGYLYLFADEQTEFRGYFHASFEKAACLCKSEDSSTRGASVQHAAQRSSARRRTSRLNTPSFFNVLFDFCCRATFHEE